MFDRRVQARALTGCPSEPLDASSREQAHYGFDWKAPVATKAWVQLFFATAFPTRGAALSPDCALGIWTTPHEVDITAGGLSAKPPRLDHPRSGCPSWEDAPADLTTAILRRIEADAAPVLGWPGKLVASHLPARGDRVEVFDAPVAAMIALEPRDRPSLVRAVVRFAGVRPETWGDALAFDVAAVATSASADSCPRWKGEARASGELVVSASDGKFVAMRLHGPYEEFEIACPPATPDATHDPDSPAKVGTRRCASGMSSVDIAWGSCSEPV